MTDATARLRRCATVLGAGLAAVLLSPIARYAAADDNGLGSGGAVFAFNFTLVVGIVLSFIFGFAIRDYLQKRALRARSTKRPAPAPPRT